MTHSLDWLVENRVLYSRVWGEQTLEDVHLSNTQLKAFLEEGTPFIHLIMDARDLTRMPNQLASLQSSLQATKSPALGWVVSISVINPVTRYLGLMIVKLFRLRFRRVETMEQAIQFLQQIDDTINWDKMQHDVLPANTHIQMP